MTKRVLLIDDDVAVATGIADLLTADGFEVTVLHTGAPAVDTAESLQPHCVVLDVGLPDIDGREVFRLLRERWPEMPVVFSSGHVGHLNDIGVAADRYVTLMQKPYSGDALTATIERLIRPSA